MTHYRRLPLDGLNNARELGGFPAHGGATEFGVFIRCEVPAALTERDIAFLRDYGVTDVIDFRGNLELERTPDVLAREPWLEYHHIPMFDESAAKGAMPETGRSREGFFWGDQYIAMTEAGKDWVRKVLTVLAGARGCVVFHCTTGKDRTGIITALLLGLCGVSGEDIAADYCVSSLYLREMYEKMRFLSPSGREGDFSDPFFSTAAENMQTLLKHWDDAYGGIEGYVRACGTGDGVISEIRKKLCGRAV